MKKTALQKFHDTLADLGYSNYYEYLSSSRWSRIRSRVLNIHKNKCLLCPLTASQVHHLRYTRKVLLGRELSALIPLCRGCHESLEFSPSGRKRTMRGARLAFNRKWKQLSTRTRKEFKTRLRKK